MLACAWTARRTAAAPFSRATAAALSADSFCARAAAGDQSRAWAFLQCPAPIPASQIESQVAVPLFAVLRLCSILPLHQQYFFAIVHVAQMQLNHFLVGRLYSAPHKGCINRQFPIPAVNQYAELHLTRSAL